MGGSPNLKRKLRSRPTRQRGTPSEGRAARTNRMVPEDDTDARASARPSPDILESRTPTSAPRIGAPRVLSR